MPIKRGRPPKGMVEKDLWAALERLKLGKPQNPALARKAKLRTLKINPSSVALEAACSRTLISHEGCAYPAIRSAILDLKNPIAAPQSLADVNRKLRQENAELRSAVKLARAENAAMVRRLDGIEKEYHRQLALIERRAQRKTDDPNAVAGTELLNTSKVISLYRNNDEVLP